MRLPPSPDSRLALAWLLGLLIVLLLLMAGPRANGQESTPPSLSGNLQEAEQALQALVTRLELRAQQVSDLQSSLKRADSKLSDLAASYATLQQTLEQAATSLQESQTALQETSTLLDESLLRFSELERQYMLYRDEMTREVRVARRWAVGFGVAAAIGCALSVYLVLR